MQCLTSVPEIDDRFFFGNARKPIDHTLAPPQNNDVDIQITEKFLFQFAEAMAKSIRATRINMPDISISHMDASSSPINKIKWNKENLTCCNL